MIDPVSWGARPASCAASAARRPHSNLGVAWLTLFSLGALVAGGHLHLHHAEEAGLRTSGEHPSTATDAKLAQVLRWRMERLSDGPRPAAMLLDEGLRPRLVHPRSIPSVLAPELRSDLERAWNHREVLMTDLSRDPASGRAYGRLVVPLVVLCGLLGIGLAGRHDRLLDSQRELAWRREVEVALRESEARHRLVLETSMDAILLTTPDGDILQANPAAVRMLGREEPELRAIVRNGIVDPDDPRGGAALETHRRTGRFVGELFLRRCDGTRFPAELSSTLFVGPKGRALTSMVIRDVSERHRLSQERLKLEARLRQQQKLESIGTLASGVAREINNPINGILAYAQLIQDRLPPGSPLTEFSQGILHETRRIAGIVRSLLTFARHDQHCHSPARLADIVENTLGLMRAILRRDGVDLEVHVPSDLPRIRCHSQQIQQVVMNLMTNGRDALNERYPVPCRQKRLLVTAAPLEAPGCTWVRLTVEDHGTGLTPEARERMFDPFFTTKPRDRGTGLGLAISHGIVKDHAGRLSAESTPGWFTRFHLDLPAIVEPLPAAA